ncbi:hypothetical protein VU08_01975 [Desulfobulbus sp. F5]|nr:hypothetical protein [Desulfobulbus sp. F5]
MKEESIVKLRITLHDSEADDEQLDRLALSLIRQLRDLEAIESLEREAGKAIDRSKGDPITVGGVILGIAVAAIPNLISLLQQWTVGNRTIKVEAPNGAKAEFTPDHRYSKEEVVEFVRQLNRIGK